MNDRIDGEGTSERSIDTEVGLDERLGLEVPEGLFLEDGVEPEGLALPTEEDSVGSEEVLRRALDYRFGYETSALRALYDRVGGELARRARQDEGVSSEGTRHRS